MSINNSALSLISLRHHNVATRGYTESIRKLASGLRISKGNDAPADLIISEGLRAQSRGLQTAMDNTQEAHNVLGTAEGGMKEMQELLHTLTSLAVHVGNSTTLPSRPRPIKPRSTVL